MHAIPRISNQCENSCANLLVLFDLLEGRREAGGGMVMISVQLMIDSK